MKKPHRFCLVGRRDRADKPYHYKECGLSNIYLLNGFTLETVDEEEWVSVQDVDGLWKAIGLKLVTTQKILSPKEIRFLRGQMNRTQAELAGLLRVDDQTVARWEKGQSRLSGPADIALRALYLTSDRAQPEGRKKLQQWLKLLTQLVEQDDPVNPGLLFEKDGGDWAGRRLAA